MLDRITGMQIFVRTAAAGSFSAAARDLGHSQTMVTKHIVALEQRLGLRLFNRSTRRLSLTEAGRTYLEACPRILREIEDAETSVAAGRVEARGVLRMNVPVSFGAQHVAPALPGFVALHPMVDVELALNDRVVDLVEEGWDLTVRIGKLAESQLVARQFASSRFVMCAAPSYLAARGTPTTAADLAGHACLRYTLSSTTSADRWHFGKDGKITVPISGPLRANSGEALRNAAVAGLGLIYQPLFLLADALRHGELVEVVLDLPPPPELGIYVMYPQSGRVAPKVRAMIEYLVVRFRAKAPWDVDLPPR
jgi:DNA-binding transcriptional LysR family regulator